jgi:hypothetical protein
VIPRGLSPLADEAHINLRSLMRGPRCRRGGLAHAGPPGAHTVALRQAAFALRRSRASPATTSIRSSRRSPTASPTSDSRPNDQDFRTALLVSPPVALDIDVFARSLAEIGRADNEDLEGLRPGGLASPRTGRDAENCRPCRDSPAERWLARRGFPARRTKARPREPMRQTSPRQCLS